MFTAILVVMSLVSSPVDVSTKSLTLNQQAALSFTNTTAPKAMADCVRVQKALRTSGYTSFCSAQAPTTAAIK